MEILTTGQVGEENEDDDNLEVPNHADENL